MIINYWISCIDHINHVLCNILADDASGMAFKMGW